MARRLKALRVDADLTQAKLAAAVGVTQPNYHRWEVGQVPIPEDKLKKLAKILKTSPEAILGKHAPIESRLYDDSAGDHLDYYGEVAVHFAGGGQALLLSISEAAFTRLYSDLQGNGPFVTVESLANQTVSIRIKAISDLYFSSEAHDDHGPEHGTYSNHVELHLPDARDWEIVESLACDGFGLEEFDEAHVKRVEDMISVSDDRLQQAVAAGDLAIDEVENKRKESEALTQQIFDMSTHVSYQLSTGQRRKVYIDREEDLFHAFYGLVAFDGDEIDEPIVFPAEGRHRTIFINKHALDYAIVPTHKFERGRVEFNAELVDELDEIGSKKAAKKKGGRANKKVVSFMQPPKAEKK